MSISNSYRVDNTDQDILRIMVTKGSTSAYTTWLKINEVGDNAFSYKNIGKRFVRLAGHGIIEEIKLENVENLHGRKDYRLTMKGLEYLIPYFLNHPENIQSIIEYINKFKVDKYHFAALLREGYVNAIETLNEYHKHTNALYYPFGMKDIDFISYWKQGHFDIEERELKLYKRLDGAQKQMNANQSSVESDMDRVFNIVKNEMLERKKTTKAFDELHEKVDMIDELMHLDNISGSSKILKDKVDMTIEQLSKHYGDCETCANFSSETPRYIISRPDGSSTYKEPRAKNKKEFLEKYGDFLNHFKEVHMTREDREKRKKKYF